MKDNTISPIPTQAPEELTDGLPDLATLREGWKQSNMPAMPISESEAGSSSPDEQSDEATQLMEIPELPALGALARHTAMAMDEPSEPFSDAVPSTAPSRKTAPIPIMALPTEPSPKSSDKQTNATDDYLTSEPSPIIPPLPMDAMPSEKIEKISLPLVRDLITKRPDLLPDENSTRTTPPASAEPKFSPSEPNTAPLSRKPDTSETEPSCDSDGGNRPDHRYTDEDLCDALKPLILPDVERYLYTPTHGIHTYLEPMLRSTVRRAIAEQMDDATPFRDVTGWDKFSWKLRAFFSSRTYDEIVFSNTKRYQVEEIYLLRRHSRSMISYASHNPSRHVKASRVKDTVKKLSVAIGKTENKDATHLPWADKRSLIIRRGEHSILVAIIHGEGNAILKSDLDYALRQSEERFGKTLAEESDIHLNVLQPLLEGCLLIQAPRIPN